MYADNVLIWHAEKQNRTEIDFLKEFWAMQYKIIIFILLSVSKFADSFICHAAVRPNSNIPTVVTLLKAKVTPNQGESMDEYRKVIVFV